MSTQEQALDNLINSLERDRFASDPAFEVYFELDGYSYRGLARGGERRHFIAATTNTFASVLLQMLLKVADLSLDTRLSEMLPSDELNGLNNYRGQDRSSEITIRSVLSQTSGIPNYFVKKQLPNGPMFSSMSANDTGWDYFEALEIAKSMKSNFRPNSGRAEYSLTNYQIVGRLIELLSGKSFRETLHENILTKLSLRDTDVLTESNLDLFDQVAPLIKGNRPYLGAQRMASLGAGGSMVSTTSDVLRFSRALFDGELISEREVDSTRANMVSLKPFFRYGLGVMSMTVPFWNPRGIEAIGNLGATGHFMFYLPEIKLHVAGTTNQLGKTSKTLWLLSQLVKRTG